MRQYIVACLSCVGMVRSFLVDKSDFAQLEGGISRWTFPCLEMHSAPYDRLALRSDCHTDACFFRGQLFAIVDFACPTNTPCIRVCISILISCDCLLSTTGQLRTHVPQLTKSARKRKQNRIEYSTGRILGLGTVGA